MRPFKHFSHHWRALSITTKFSAIFGLVLALILLMAITNYASLTLLRRQTEASIVASTEIQALVLEMDRGLQEARVLQRDFFLRYPSEGLAAAREAYALEAVKKLSHVVDLSAELKQRLVGAEVSTALEQRRVDVNLYLSAAERFADTFLDSVDLITQLAADETGLEAQLAQNSSELRDVFQSIGDSALIQLYNDLRAHEKDYLSNRQRPQMQSALNAVFQLRETIQNTDVLTTEAKSSALTYLDDYESIAQDIVELDLAIRSKLNDFELQAQAVDPISAQLIASVTTEVELARARIAQANQLATLILIGAAGVGLLLVALAIRIINTSVTRNVVKLTETVGQWQAGDLGTSAQIVSADELGILAQAFNAMARQLHDLIDSLEQRVAERTRGLQTAAEVSRATTALLDPDELLRRVVDLVRERFGLYYVGLFLLDQKQRFAVLNAGTGEAGQQMLAQGHRLEVGGDSMIGQCVSRDEARIALDVGEEAVRFANPYLPETRSELALPLRARGRVIGAMTVQSTQEAAFDEAGIAVMQTMADQVAVAIDNARLFAETQAALKEAEVTHRRYLRQAWAEYLPTARKTRYEIGAPGTTPLGDAVLPEIQAAVERGGSTVLGGDDQADVDHSALVTPIALRGEILGALGIHDGDKTRRWSADEIALVEAIAERMALAAENLRLIDETQRRATQDRLVGEVTGRVRQSLDLDTVLQTAAREMRTALRLHDITIRLESPNGHTDQD